ncbi:hypothetical protein SAMN05421797_10531 [Maribacter ulvicola]|uniref:YHS domain-containing protein n=2 Tax=Maribacter ulvicola TaxID=228959 RepID=A0A1N6X8N8_9FLAO|nr:hypothetical protein SAMN05421797_10531 [Maribacter ulvicola]
MLVLMGMLLSNGLIAQEANEIYNKELHYNLKNNSLAIEGYDPVAYFTENRAIEGSLDYQLEENGVFYRFSSETNKKIFLNNPEKYEPQYGGWCAYAMGESGDKVTVNPKTFKIIDGKLYLFYNQFLTNTLKSWNKNEATLKKQADVNWMNTLKL